MSLTKTTTVDQITVTENGIVLYHLYIFPVFNCPTCTPLATESNRIGAN